MIKLPELLAPAGDWEKMETAFRYGADAVFLGGKEFGLRAGSGNFTIEELGKAVTYAHELNRKITSISVDLNLRLRKDQVSTLRVRQNVILLSCSP